MKIRTLISTTATVWLASTLWALPTHALDKCTAKINGRDGSIEVAAKSVEGTLSWGWSATSAIQPFANEASCVRRGRARKCVPGSVGSPLATTPPPNCTLHLADDVESCTAFIKKCLPGLRPLVEFPTRVIDNLDGTVTDTRTGLMWEQKTDGNPSSFHHTELRFRWSTGSLFNPDGGAFVQFLAELNGPSSLLDPFAGYGDWRLPTLAELKTIVDSTQGECGGGTGPCLDQAVFGPTQASRYWSASIKLGGSSVWTVDFRDGEVVEEDRGEQNYVRAVRGPITNPAP